MGGPGLVRGRERAAAARQTAMERKASHSLQDAVKGRLARMAISGQAGASLPVAVWLSADVAGAERAVVDRHPEVPWIANRPVVNDLATIRSLRAELWTARRTAYVAAAAGLREQVQRLGGRVAYASTSAPVVFLDVPASAVAERRPAGRRREPGPGRRLAPIDGDRRSRRGRQLDDEQRRRRQRGARGGGRVPQRAAWRRHDRQGGEVAQHDRPAGLHRRRHVRPSRRGWPAPSRGRTARGRAWRRARASCRRERAATARRWRTTDASSPPPTGPSHRAAAMPTS